MDHVLHLVVSALLFLGFRKCGFSLWQSILTVVCIGFSKEFLDTFKPSGFVDFWDLMGDGYGILLGVYLDDAERTVK